MNKKMTKTNKTFPAAFAFALIALLGVGLVAAFPFGNSLAKGMNADQSSGSSYVDALANCGNGESGS